MLAIEKDSRCMPALAEIGDAYPGQLEVINGDALQVDPLAHLTPPIRIAANLPYNVGNRAADPLADPQGVAAFLVFVDADVPERGRAAHRRAARIEGLWPVGDSVAMAHGHADCAALAARGPSARRPKVHSAVVHLTALPEPRFAADAKTLERVVAKAFNQRRKMLRAALKGIAPDLEDRLIASGIKPTDRAETVSLEQFCALARNIKA